MIDMRYFVTGATGFIGSVLVKRLIKDGHKVSALVRDTRKAKWMEELGVDVHRGDITDPESLREPIEDVDGIFHLAAWNKTGGRDSNKAELVNVEGTRNVLNAMKRAKVPKGVYTSTLGIFSDTKGEVKNEDHLYKGKHITDYHHTKWEAHYSVAKPMILNQELPLVIVMPGAVYGPGDTSTTGKMMDDYLRKKLGFIPKGTEFCWSHVEDVVEGLILAMDKGVPGETYIIAGPRHSIIQTFEIAENITGIGAPKFKPPPGFLRFYSGIMSVVNLLVPMRGRHHPETLKFLAGTAYLGDNTKAKESLGYSPRSLEDGLKDYLPSRMEELGVNK
jgi:nucleoside-diphosphate-sugar epimerase